MTDWISVENALPKEKEVVLACDIFNNFVSLAKINDQGDEYSFDLMNIEGIEIDTQVTHWMPLPNAPKE